jgi:hypothetical protein
MSRTLAKQKLHDAADALRCAQSNMQAATTLLASEPGVDLIGAGLNLMEAGCREMVKSLREAVEVLES